MPVGREGAGKALHRPVVLGELLQGLAHGAAVGGAGLLYGAGEEVGEVVGRRQAAGGEDVGRILDAVALLQRGEQLAGRRSLVPDEGEELDRREVDLPERGPGEVDEIAAGDAVVGDDGHAPLGGGMAATWRTSRAPGPSLVTKTMACAPAARKAS